MKRFMTLRGLLILGALMGLVLGASGCKKDSEAIPTPQSVLKAILGTPGATPVELESPPIVQKAPSHLVILGGLGGNQTTQLASALREALPGMDIREGPGRDGYKADLEGMLADIPEDEEVILLAHSFGTQALVDFLESHPGRRCRLLVLMDPVKYDPLWGSPIIIPLNAEIEITYYRSGLLGPKTAKVENSPNIREVKGGHNDVPYDSGMKEEIIGTIKAF